MNSASRSLTEKTLEFCKLYTEVKRVFLKLLTRILHGSIADEAKNSVQGFMRRRSLRRKTPSNVLQLIRDFKELQRDQERFTIFEEGFT